MATPLTYLGPLAGGRADRVERVAQVDGLARRGHGPSKGAGPDIENVTVVTGVLVLRHACDLVVSHLANLLRFVAG